MKKLFITLTALCAMSMGAWASDDDYTGSAGTASELTWTMPYEGGQMTISGDYMPMLDTYDGFNAIWNNDNVRPKITSILMKNGQTIGAHAFKNCENLTSFTYSPTSGSGLVKIGDYAFSQSAKLASIQFSGCNGLRYIGERAFAGIAIKTFTINKPSINPGETILENLGVNYDYCVVGASAFADCPYLSTVYMKDDTPFAGTYNNFLNDYAYLVVNSAEAAATYRAAWTEIADRIICLQENITFENEAVKEICISNWDTNGDGELSYEEAFAVTDFGDAFAGNTTITKIDGLEPFVNVTVIGSGAFAGCTALESITIPPHITDIADDAFTGCTNLKEIHFVNKTPFKDSFTIQTNGRTYIIVPDDAVSTYDALWTGKSELIIGESHIIFQCPEVKRICVANWDTDGDGELSYTEAAAVKTIASSVFKDNTGITSFNELRYFTGLTTIGISAFEGCSGLTSVSIPNSVRSIGSSGFYLCSSLTSVHISDIGAWCKINFGDTASSNPLWCAHHLYVNGKEVKDLIIPNSVTSISDKAFSGCSGLTSVTIPTSVTSIGKSAFSDCSSLTSVHISDIGAWCKINFGGTGSNPLEHAHHLYVNGEEVKDLIIPTSVTSIGGYAFSGCSGLTSVTIPTSVTSIGGGGFSGCSSLTSVHISDIGAWCKINFGNSYSNPLWYAHHLYVNGEEVKDLIIPNSVTSIGNYAFSGCSGLTSVSIPNNVTSIGNYTFSGCSGLTSVTIPNSVTSIGTNAFADVRIVVFDSETPVPAIYNNFSNAAVYFVPDNSVADYQKAWAAVPAYQIRGKSGLTPLGWTEVVCEAQATTSYLVELIGEENLLNVVRLRISGTINSYDMMVMRNKMLNLIDLDLTNANIVANSYNYGTGVSENNIFPDFMKGRNLLAILLPKSITKIGNYALQNCTMIKSITIPDNVTTIGDYAFDGCATLSAVNISANSQLNTIGKFAFGNLKALKSIDLSPASKLTKIGNYAFAFSKSDGLVGLQNIIFPTSLESIGDYAFQKCWSLNSITINANIGSYAFYNCAYLTDVTIGNDVTSIGECAFSYCGLQKAEIGMGLTSVPRYLFEGCNKLKEVKLSPKTTTIKSGAFKNCTSLTEFHLPPFLTTIEGGAFSGCSNLKEIYAYMPDVPAISISTFTNYLTSTLYAPGFLWDSYFYDNGWNQFLQVLKCDLRPGDYEAFYTNKDLYFKKGEERITHDRPIVELGNQGSIIVEGEDQEFTTVDMKRGTTSSSLIGDKNIVMDELRVKIEVSANRWYFLCFPYEVTISECTYPGKYAWRYYDGALRAANGTGGWQKIEGDVLKAGVGYIFQSNTAGNLIVKFAAPEFGGDRPTELQAHIGNGNAADASWNFVGNPYTCYYNLISDDFASPITVWNGTTYVAYRPGDDNYHLQPYEAFFVQKTENAEAINFKAEGRETYSQSVATAQTRASFQRSITNNRFIVNLTISDNDTAAIDRTRLVMNNKASCNYELACDASKFISEDAAAQIYTLEGSVKMAINERPGQGKVRIGYTAQKAGTLRIEAQRMDSPMELIDTKTNCTFDLAQGAYEFTTEAGTFDNRFLICASRGADEISNLTAATGVVIGMQEGGLNIGGAADKLVTIYGTNGTLVAEQYGNGYVALPSGIYVVKVDGHSAKMYVK